MVVLLCEFLLCMASQAQDIGLSGKETSPRNMVVLLCEFLMYMASQAQDIGSSGKETPL